MLTFANLTHFSLFGGANLGEGGHIVGLDAVCPSPLWRHYNVKIYYCYILNTFTISIRVYCVDSDVT